MTRKDEEAVDLTVEVVIAGALLVRDVIVHGYPSDITANSKDCLRSILINAIKAVDK